MEIGRAGLGGDGKGWRVGDTVYGDRDNLPRDLITQKLTTPTPNASSTSATPSAPA